MVKLAVGLALLASCATVMPLGASLGREREESTEPLSTAQRCEVAWWVVGMLIDAVVVAGDVTYGETIDGYDALLFVPVGLDAIISTSTLVRCLGS